MDAFSPLEQAQKLQIGATVIYKPQHPKFIDIRYMGKEAVIRSLHAEIESYYIKFHTGFIFLVSASDLQPI